MCGRKSDGICLKPNFRPICSGNQLTFSFSRTLAPPGHYEFSEGFHGFLSMWNSLDKFSSADIFFNSCVVRFRGALVSRAPNKPNLSLETGKKSNQSSPTKRASPNALNFTDWRLSWGLGPLWARQGP